MCAFYAFSQHSIYYNHALKILVSPDPSSGQNYSFDLVLQESFLEAAPPACMDSFPNHIRGSGKGCEYISPKAVVVPEAKGSHNCISRWSRSHWLLRDQVIYHFKMGFLANYQNDVSIKTNQKYRECMIPMDRWKLMELSFLTKAYHS